MGRVKFLLASVSVAPVSDRYAGLYSVESCPDGFHTHWNNLRLNMGQPDFDIYSEAMAVARANWVASGKPGPNIENMCFRTGRTVSAGDPDSTSFRVEWDDLMGDAIHIHLRGCRLEFSIPEFAQYAETIAKAYAVLRRHQEETGNADKQ